MIFFDKIEIVTGSKFSGIALECLDGKLFFYPPKGTINTRNATYHQVVNLYFTFYRLYFYLWSKEEVRNQFNIDMRDGVSESLDDSVYSEHPNESHSILYYSQIDKIWKFLDIYNSIVDIHPASGLKKCQQVPSKILKKDLELALYESDGTPFIADSYKQSIYGQKSVPNIELLFSFIAYSLLEELNEFVPPKILVNARYFVVEELQSKLTSLYRFKSQRFIWNVMVEYFYTCKKSIESNGRDSKSLLIAVEDFLFSNNENSQNGVIWGFSNFWQIWEALSVSYKLQKHVPHSVYYIDPSIEKVLENCCIKKSNHSSIVTNSLTLTALSDAKPFVFKPDLVVSVKDNSEEHAIRYFLTPIDWNDFNISCFYGLWPTKSKVGKKRFPIGYRIIDVSNFLRGPINIQEVPEFISLERPLPEGYISIPGYNSFTRKHRFMVGPSAVSSVHWISVALLKDNSFFRYDENDKIYCNLDSSDYSYEWLDAVGDIRIRCKRMGFETPRELLDSLNRIAVQGSSSFSSNIERILLRDIPKDVCDKFLSSATALDKYPSQEFVQIVDAKYKEIDFYRCSVKGETGSKELDIRKQLCYEELVRRGFSRRDINVTLSSLFLLPYCDLKSADNELVPERASILNDLIDIQQVDVIKAIRQFVPSFL